jgi:hypothetical protein
MSGAERHEVKNRGSFGVYVRVVDRSFIVASLSLALVAVFSTPSTGAAGTARAAAAAGTTSQAAVATAPPASAPVTMSVTTYHYNVQRTGWNHRERALNTQNVNSKSFGLVTTVPLDAQVDAQPLILTNMTVAGGAAPGTYTLAYVVTENDTIYAIDTATGKVVLKRNFGPPVPRSALPGGCANNAPTVGITSTPVIDAASKTLYLIAYTFEAGVPAYALHAIDTTTLADTVAPVAVTAMHRLFNGTTAVFNPSVERQRPALLETNGTIYAGFGSFCDHAANLSRGWVLGWSAATLAPLAANDLIDTFAKSPEDRFLSSIWMSGYGLSSDETGSIYFVTGNSDPASYDGHNDVQESVIRESADLTKLQTLFTPYDASQLDMRDEDVGSGGALVIPNLDSVPVSEHLAVVAGKVGGLYLLDRDAMGGYSPHGDNVLQTVPIGGCWCGESFFIGSDDVPRIVTSGDMQVGVWKLQTSPKPALTLQSRSAALQTGQDPGFMTSVSSNDKVAGSAVIWAVSRPLSAKDLTLRLYAIDPGDGDTIFEATAGSWGAIGGDSDVVPVVANGQVFVASDAQLAIFGLTSSHAAATRLHNVATVPLLPLEAGGHEFFGTVAALAGTHITLRLRTGSLVRVDAAAATAAYRTTTLYRGEALLIEAKGAGPGAFTALSIQRAKSSPALWWPDR